MSQAAESIAGDRGTPAPRLTIGLPVYNGERYLVDSLESLLTQTYADFELIISDNASTDGTAAICERYALRDPRIRYVRQHANIGAAANHNFVVEQARGELFKWASHDDLYHCDLVRRCVQLLDDDDALVLAHADSALIDQDGLIIAEPEYSLDTGSLSPVKRFRSLLYGRGGNDIYGVIRTDVMRATHGHGSYHHADRTLVAELALHGRFGQWPEVLYYRRDHPDRAERAPDRRNRAVNLDPGRRSHSMLRLLSDYVLGYLRAIEDAPMTRVQKAACLAELGGYVLTRLIPFHQLTVMTNPDPAVRSRGAGSPIVRAWTRVVGAMNHSLPDERYRAGKRPNLGGWPTHGAASATRPQTGIGRSSSITDEGVVDARSGPDPGPNCGDREGNRA